MTPPEKPDEQETPPRVPPVKPSKQERQWGALSHAAVALALIVPAIGGWAGPLAIRLTKGKESRFVEANATEALNYGIVVSALQLVAGAIGGNALIGGGYGVGSEVPILSSLVGLLPILIALAALLLPGLAALRANDGKLAEYPAFIPRLVGRSDKHDDRGR